MQRAVLSALFVTLLCPRAFPAATNGRAAYLEWMNKNLPEVPAWSEWQKKTGTLPPDFDALPRANFLPDPFRFHDGRKVNMLADWPARRAEIRQLFEQWDIG